MCETLLGAKDRRDWNPNPQRLFSHRGYSLMGATRFGENLKPRHRPRRIRHIRRHIHSHIFVPAIHAVLATWSIHTTCP